MLPRRPRRHNSPREVADDNRDGLNLKMARRTAKNLETGVGPGPVRNSAAIAVRHRRGNDARHAQRAARHASRGNPDNSETKRGNR